MNEIQRQAYLSAMGIDGYMPRWILPAAPASVLCELPFLPASALNEGDSTPDVALPEVRTGAPVRASAVDVLSELNIGPKPQVAKQAETRVADTQTEVQAASIPVPVPRFALTVWRISDDLMVIDSRQAQLALPTERLLANITRALGYNSQALPKAEVVRWPLLENATEEQGEAEAREMLHAYLDAHLLLNPAKHLLLMGAEAARYILPARDDYPNDWIESLVGHPVALKELATTAVVSHSLTAMLQDPGLKAATWRAIQPLRINAG